MWTKKQFKGVRRQFSAPCTFAGHAHDETCLEKTSTCTQHYCVGGALMRASGAGLSFPTSRQLGVWLRGENLDLNWAVAKEVAEKIIDQNDAGKFKAAWEIASGALCSPRRKS